MMMNIFQKAKDIACDSLFTLLPINFAWIDSAGLILGCNQYTLDCLGFPDFNSVVGKHTADITSAEAWINTMKVIEARKAMTFEEIHISTAGKQLYFISIKSPIQSSDGNVVGVVNIAIDITDRKMLEIELKAAKIAAETSNRAKTQFLANMQHDLRTPFSGILGLSDLLESQETDPEKKETLGYIVQSAEALLEH